MERSARCLLGVALFGLVLLSAGNAADWPAFRGSQFGQSPEKDLPGQLTEANILWKIKLPGPGASSPVTAGGKIFVTCYTGYGGNLTNGPPLPPGGKKPFPPPGGKKPFPPPGGKPPKGLFDGPDVGGDQKNMRFEVLCLDAKTGERLWRQEIQPTLPEAKFAGMIRDHGYASSTPATDGKHLYVFFGKTGVLCFDMQGQRIWQQSVGTDTDVWGSASSPILYKDLVIVNAAIESRSLVALDKNTGQEKWRVKPTGRSWSSPILAKVNEGHEELVVSLPGKLAAFDPSTGKELWHCKGISSSDEKLPIPIEPYTVSTPIARDGIVYLVGGGGPTTANAMAVKAGATGDVTKTHVLWRKKASEALGSPVLVGKSLCFVSGILTALDIADGRTSAKERVCDNFMDYTSPVLADGKIYALTRREGLFVLDGGDKFRTLATVTFPEKDGGVFNSAPALSDGRLYVRSNAYLYCLGKKGPK